MVNLAGIIYTKTGTVAKSTFGLDSFFGLPVSSMSDPTIFYDSISGRWFASIIDIPGGRVVFAVSTTNDPTGIFNLYAVSAGRHRLPDQPYIGTSDDNFVITANIFNSAGTSYFGIQYWILNKAQLVAGSSTVNFVTNTPDPNVFTIRPVRHLTSTSIFYMVTNCVGACVPDPASTTSTVIVYAVSGTPPGAVTVTTQSVAVSTSTNPPNALQPDPTTVATNDNRILSAVWESNTLWMSWNDACIPSGDTTTRSCARLLQLTVSGTRADQGSRLRLCRKRGVLLLSRSEHVPRTTRGLLRTVVFYRVSHGDGNG
jgi:hypothetical protein